MRERQRERERERSPLLDGPAELITSREYNGSERKTEMERALEQTSELEREKKQIDCKKNR